MAPPIHRLPTAPSTALLLALALPSGCGQPEADLPEPASAEAIVVFMEAGVQEIEALRERFDDESDFQTVADDLLWYRAQAHEFLEERGFAEVLVRERRPLHFRVEGELRTYTFEDLPYLDLVVAYRPGAEPLAVAPIEVHREVVTPPFAGAPRYALPPTGMDSAPGGPPALDAPAALPRAGGLRANQGGPMRQGLSAACRFPGGGPAPAGLR